jgi:glycosyltransferase involved in cell wall biosynthesis
MRQQDCCSSQVSVCRLPLKVLLLTTSFPLIKGSSSGIFIKKLVNNLPSDFKVTVLTPDGPFEDIPNPSSYELVRFRYAPKRWQKLAHGSGGIVAALSQKHLSCLLIPVLLCSSLVVSCWYAFRADILHANWSINGVVAGIAGRITGKPVVITLRGSDVNLMHTSLLMRKLVHFCLYLGEIIVTVSPSLKRIIEEEFPSYCNKIKVIPNGIDEIFFHHRKKSPEQPEKVCFLYAGNLTEGKGVHLILAALASLTTVNWSLDIIGDGPEREKLVEYSQRSALGSKVIFHGAVAPEEVPVFLQKADVFVFASFSEGRPNVVLEAMAAGVPVIASAIPAVLDLIEDGKQGLIFPVGDEKRLSELMEHIITHPGERYVMGGRAREFIISQGFSWQKTGQQYADIYTHAVCGSAEGK